MDDGGPFGGLSPADWITAGVIVAVALVAAIAINITAQRAVGRLDSDRFASRFIGRVLALVAVVIGFVYALSAIDVRIGPLLGALGIGGLALAFALQDILENFAAGVILQIRRPVAYGDQVWTNDYEGTVQEINLRSTVIRTFDGEIVYVPNADVLKNPLVNYTERALRRTTLVVGVDYDANLDRAKELITTTAGNVDGVMDDPHPEAYVNEFGESSINIAVRYWHRPEIAELWRVRDLVAVRIKAALDEAGIGIPFPQRTLRFAGGGPADGAEADGSAGR